MTTRQIKVKFPDAPGNAATIDLFNSITACGRAGRFRNLNISMIEITWSTLSHASAANGLKIYRWDTTLNSGAGGWDQLSMPDSSGVATMPVTVSAVAADTNAHYGFVVTHLGDVKITYENSANVLSGWGGEITLHQGASAVQL